MLQSRTLNKRVEMKAKQTEQKEMGRIELSDTQDLVASLIDNEKLHLRIFIKTDNYTGATKRGKRSGFMQRIMRCFHCASKLSVSLDVRCRR